MGYSSPLKLGMALLALFLSHTSFLLGASVSDSFTETDVDNRDSLRRRAVMAGSANLSCYLSYPIGSSRLDPSFGNNTVELSALSHFFRLALGDSLLIVKEICLTGYCSPDGSAQLNERLSAARVLRFCDYLKENDPFFPSYTADIQSRGADWPGLRRLLSDSGYSWSAEALRIIDSNEPAERKKRWLAALGNGEAHRALYQLYPLLRRVEVKVIYDVQRMREQGVLPMEDPVVMPPSWNYPVGRAYCDTLIYQIAEPAVYLKRQHESAWADSSRSSVVNPLLALKTNLLFDAAQAPNIELEVPIGKRWSVLAEYTFPWWLSREDRWCFEMLQFGIEGRYWLGNREKLRNGRKRNLLTGWFAGLYAGGGYYDLQFNPNDGYQGEFYIAAGVSGGYALRLSKRLNLEFSLGVGALSTKYRHYEVVRGAEKTELVRQNYGRLFWFGPTKAKISLVWLLGNKKGGKK